MPPLGVGVNLPMLDASDLAVALVAAADWRDAVAGCERRMLERAAPIAEQTAAGFDAWFSDDPAEDRRTG